jgi:hypothetical protein
VMRRIQSFAGVVHGKLFRRLEIAFPSMIFGSIIGRGDGIAYKHP